MADATKIRVGAGGVIYWGNTALHSGTAAVPSDASTAPGAGWTDLGHVTQDGVAETNSKTQNDILNWYGTVVRSITSEQTFQLSFSFMETNAEVLEAYYGDSSATDSAWVVKAVQGARRAWIIDAVDGALVRRLFVPDAQVTDTGDITSATEDAIVYPITITCYPDGSDVLYYGYVD